MWKKITTTLTKSTIPTPINITLISPKGKTINLTCSQGTNLLDLTNRQINQQANVYGLCNKQLACTTCSVDIMKLYAELPQPSEEQLDILLGLPRYKKECTRMACQLIINRELNGMVVKVGRNLK